MMGLPWLLTRPPCFSPIPPSHARTPSTPQPYFAKFRDLEFPLGRNPLLIKALITSQLTVEKLLTLTPKVRVLKGGVIPD